MPAAADAAAEAVEALMKWSVPRWLAAAGLERHVVLPRIAEVIGGTMSDLNWRHQPAPDHRSPGRGRLGPGVRFESPHEPQPIPRRRFVDIAPWPAPRNGCIPRRGRARW